MHEVHARDVSELKSSKRKEEGGSSYVLITRWTCCGSSTPAAASRPLGARRSACHSVDQGTHSLALAHVKRVSPKMRTLVSPTARVARSFEKPAGIHPLESTPPVADGNPGAENCYLVRCAMKLSQSRASVERCASPERPRHLAIAIKISAQIEWFHAKRDFVLLCKRSIRDGSLDRFRNVMELGSLVGCLRRCAIKLRYGFRL